MIIYRNFDDISADFTACIGFFDGVHAGHRFLLRHLRDVAASRCHKSAVITFANHPRKVVQPDLQFGLIDSPEEKLRKLEEAGVDACFVLNFTEEVRQMTAEQFIRDFLAARLHVRELLIGYDHRFGHNRAEGFDDYVRYGRECGIDVIQEPVFDGGDAGEGMKFSSSEIRRALADGNIAKANLLLGTDYSITGRVMHGHKLGRTLGFPTANLQPLCADKILPAIGVYAVMATLDDGSRYPAMLNIGIRPTVDDTKNITLEVHVIGFKGDLYDHCVVISFVNRIRDERRMHNIDELREQLSRDYDSALQMLGIR